MKLPVIDTRNEKDIFEQLISLAKSYVPEWNVEENKDDAGILLTKIFSDLFYDTLQRYNKIPYKNLIYFLNLLGANMLPCMSAKGYITVVLNEGTKDGVFIKKGTRLYGQTEQEERILFETKDDFLAVDNSILEIYCKSPQQDKIVKNFDKQTNKSFRLFDFYGSENLQKNRLYFCADEILSTGKGAKIFITVCHHSRHYLEEKTAKFFADKNFIRWYFLSEKGMILIENIVSLGNQIEFILEKDFFEAELFDYKSHWFVCEIIKEEKEDEICFTNMKISSSASHIQPESLYYNDICLTKYDFLPFGEKFSIYDDFYILSNQVFGKKGAMIFIEMELDYIFTEFELLEAPPVKWKPVIREEELKEPEKQDIFIEKVIWEYWNGNGWARLFSSNEHETIFKITEKKTAQLQFICPQDMQTAFVGADYGYWIRARILSVNNEFRLNSRYYVPVVKSLYLSYDYKNSGQLVNHIWKEKDMILKKYEKDNREEIYLFQKQKSELPAAYFLLSQSLKSGPIRLYFWKEGVNFSNLPSLKWEYWGNLNGIEKWIELKVSDETQMFQRSGIVSFICKDNFEKTMLFGKDGYWIRVVNMDKRYEKFSPKEKELLPCFKGIYFNTVKVEQQETMNTEYFYIDKEEANKACHLNFPNVLDIEVWIDEANTLLGNDKFAKYHVYSDNVIMETDDFGQILEYWVKWKKIDSFAETEAEDKVYFVDEKEGIVLFGDGIHGKIPFSMEKESIRISYKICSGEKGNFLPFQIEGFSDAVPFVKSVNNLELISGGCDSETVGNAINRCLKTIKHQNRIVSYEDYEILVKQADRNIIDVKTMTSNQEGKNGFIQIAVLPKLYLAADTYFLGIRNNIIHQINEKAPAVLTFGNKIEIFEVQYIEYCLDIKAVIKDYNDYHETYHEIETKLEKFLNPITGNFDGHGFMIGTLPDKMKIYNYLKNIRTIIEIKKINIFCYERVREYRLEIDYDTIFDRPFAVPVNGTHEIEINIQ